jgi:polysaccharide export outer membrane protein
MGMPLLRGLKMSSRMKNSVARLFYLVFVLSLVTGGHTQQPSSAQDSKSTDPLQACAATGQEDYKLGDGDQISVEVIEYPTLSGKHTVGPDGKITLSVAGSIKVAGSTREEAAGKIRDALTPYYKSPTVVVGVDVYSSDYILVMGAVGHPGPMTFDEPPTLLSVISRAGLLPELNSSAIQSKPIAIPERVALFCGGHTIAWESFRQLLESGSPDLQMKLGRDVVVYVPSPDERYVSIFGEVSRPGMVQLQDGSTLAQVLAEVGGIVTDRSGRLPKIQIIHEYNKSVEIVRYEDILLSKKIDLKLQTGDIIYVPESKFSRTAATFEKISPLIGIATVGTLIDRP